MAESGVVAGQGREERGNRGRNGPRPQVRRIGMRQEGERHTVGTPTETPTGSLKKNPSTPILRPKPGNIRPVPIRQSSIPIKTKTNLTKVPSTPRVTLATPSSLDRNTTPRVLLSSSSASPQVWDFAYPRLTPVHAYSSTSEAAASLRQNLEAYSPGTASGEMKKDKSNIPVSLNKEKAMAGLRRVASGFLPSVRTMRMVEEETRNIAETRPATPLTTRTGLGTPVAVRKVILEDMAEMRAQWKQSLGIPLLPSTPIKTAQPATTPGPRVRDHGKKKVNTSAAKQTGVGVKSGNANTVEITQREHTSATPKTSRSIPQTSRTPIFNLPQTSCEVSPSYNPPPSSSTPKGSPSRISWPRGLFGDGEAVPMLEYDMLARLRREGSRGTPSKEIQSKLDKAIDRKIKEDREAGRRFGQWECRK